MEDGEGKISQKEPMEDGEGEISLKDPMEHEEIYNPRPEVTTVFNTSASKTFKRLRAHGIIGTWTDKHTGMSSTPRSSSGINYMDAILVRCLLRETDTYYDKSPGFVDDELLKYGATVLGKATFENEDFQSPVLAQHLAERFSLILLILEALLHYNAYGTAASLTPLVLKLWLMYEKNKNPAMNDLTVENFALVVSVCMNRKLEQSQFTNDSFWDLIFQPMGDLQLKSHVNMEMHGEKVKRDKNYNDAMTTISTNLQSIFNPKDDIKHLETLLNDEQKKRAGLIERSTKKARKGAAAGEST